MRLYVKSIFLLTSITKHHTPRILVRTSEVLPIPSGHDEYAEVDGQGTDDPLRAEIL